MMKAIKNILLPVLLLCMVQGALAEKTAQAVLMSDNSMYFVYDEPVTGSTYKGKTVSMVWNATTDAPTWKTDDRIKNVTKVVFDESFATVRVTDCGYWFMGMNNLTTIEDIRYLNTSDVTSMFDMFANCSQLTTLDLSNFDTSKVTDMQYMFQGCSALTTIYVSKLWDTTKVGSSSDMFSGCTSLKGGNNTPYNSEHTDKDYARIDGGISSSTPGYLTEKDLTTLLISNDADNDAKITAYKKQKKNVQLVGRTLYKDGYWNTLCLPFDVSISGGIFAGAGVKIKIFDQETKLEGNTLTLKFTDVSSTIVDAGVPFIVKWEPGDNIVNPTFENVTISASVQTITSTDGKVQFVGKYSPFEITSDNISDILYIGSENKIGYAKAPRTLKSCRAHFYIPTPAASAPAVTTINFIDGEATSLSEELKMKNEESAGAWYTLDGRRLSSQPMTKGIYVRNGRKEIIR